MVFVAKKWLKYAEKYKDDETFKGLSTTLEHKKCISYKNNAYLIDENVLLIAYAMYKLATDDCHLFELQLFYVLPDNDLKATYNYLMCQKYGLLNGTDIELSLAKLDAIEMSEILSRFREMNKIVYEAVGE